MRASNNFRDVCRKSTYPTNSKQEDVSEDCFNLFSMKLNIFFSICLPAEQLACLFVGCRTEMLCPIATTELN